jgi:hypothetical protein
MCLIVGILAWHDTGGVRIPRGQLIDRAVSCRSRLKYSGIAMVFTISPNPSMHLAPRNDFHAVTTDSQQR